MFIYDWLWAGPELWWQGAWGSVVLPWLVVGYALLRFSSELFRGPLLMVIGWSLLGSIVSGYWAETSEALSLHLLPVFFVAMAILLYRGLAVHPLLGFCGCYLSLFGADFVHAVWRLHATSHSIAYLGGIGGAGLADGLFVFPTCTAMLIVYARRLRPRNKELHGVAKAEGTLRLLPAKDLTAGFLRPE